MMGARVVWKNKYHIEGTAGNRQKSSPTVLCISATCTPENNPTQTTLYSQQKKDINTNGLPLCRHKI